jgi:hypothetical protein
LNKERQEKPIVLSRGFSTIKVGRFWRNTTAGFESAASDVKVNAAPENQGVAGISIQ